MTDMEHKFENGRRYHSFEAGKYVLPNDQIEANRLNLQHQVWLLTLSHRLWLAPIDSANIKTALDIGTGTGIWATNFAAQHPSCRVVGIDLSPVEPAQPPPPNCEFVIGDAEASGPFSVTNVDYIHSRLLILSMTNWPAYIQRCYDNLAPGGWLELQEGGFPTVCDDGTCSLSDPPAFMHFTRLIVEAGAKKGIDWDFKEKFQSYFAHSGFINFKREDYKWPIGGWMRNEKVDGDRLGLLGETMVANVLEFVDGTKAFFTRVLGWSNEDYNAYAAKCKEGIKAEQEDQHQYISVSVYYAQKPPA